MKKKFVPSADAKIGILGNLEKSSTTDTALELIKILKERGIRYVVQEEISRELKKRFSFDTGSSTLALADVPSNSDVIISLGGDGTILRTAKIVGELGKPILGVNLGKLGFLAELNFDELRNSIDELLKGKFNLEERTALKVVFRESGKISMLYGLNDVVVDKAGSSRMIDLETYVDSEYLTTYRADGIVISTPTGSTGYGLSTGGPIITPESRVIAISPISPHTLSARPVIVPDTSEIRVVVHSSFSRVLVTADGQAGSLLPPPAEFNISLASHKVNLLRKGKNGFFGLLRSKLLWGVDIRSAQDSEKEPG